ncbi:hypothetical protein [Pseudomonas sp. NFIX28]|jgi:hypothetical protein|nr:hypothetical protein [Pseudomonas sp. NFIX28]
MASMGFQEAATPQPPEPLNTLHTDGFKVLRDEMESLLPLVGHLPSDTLG